jgi:hypothetical protein
VELSLMVPVGVLELVGPRVSSSSVWGHSEEIRSLYLSAHSKDEVGEDLHEPKNQESQPICIGQLMPALESLSDRVLNL